MRVEQSAIGAGMTTPRNRPWTARSVQNRIELGEDSTFELKEAFFERGRVRRPHRESVANELAAFANARGGALVFSVADDGNACDLSREQMDLIEDYVSNICEQRINPALPFLTARVRLPGGRPVLIVDVEQSASVHRSPRG